MRFFSVGIGLNIALCGLTVTNLAAVAEPPPVNAGTQAQSYSTSMLQGSRDRLVVIRGTGVEFTVPKGFKGGVPSSTEIKALATEVTKMYPSMSSFVNMLAADPTFMRAMAIDTAKQDPEIVLITRLPIPATVELPEIAEMMSKMLPSMLPPEFKVVEQKIDMVGSRQILRLTVDVELQGTKFKESIGMFKAGNEVFQVTYVYSGENTTQARPIFDRIITSFKTVPTDLVTTSAN